MRHGFANKKLNRTSEHRKALLKNMLNSLIKYEQITTTLPKAKFLKPQADKIITLGKKETLHSTKMLISKLQNINSTNKVKNPQIKKFSDKRIRNFSKSVHDVLLNLAKQVVSDGEGASKLISVNCINCKTEKDVIKAYRNYYINEKSRFAVWKHASQPDWYNEGVKSANIRL